VNVAQLKRFCRAFPGATETLHGEPWNFLVHAVRGRKFAYFKTSDPERWRFSTKVTPDRFVELTGVPGVKPARYRGRYGWVTIVNVSGFPAPYLKELVEWSYERARGRIVDRALPPALSMHRPPSSRRHWSS
jgi:predicted DNA-binding protein (MmcQ/YjbR family)